MKAKPPDLAGLLAILEKAGKAKPRVMVRELRDIIGRRSFAPLLLAVSLVGFTPLGGVPGVPTVLATIVVLIAVQIVMGFDALWLPNFLLDREVEGQKLARGVRSLRPAARVVDRAIRPRLVFLTERPYSYASAVACLMIALTVPPLELVPFVDLPLWAALVAFSLAMVAHDGLLVIAAFVLTITGAVLVGLALA
jgi:hypothetical protein